MTDDEYNDILNKLRASGFAKSMCDVEENIVTALFNIADSYSLSVIDLLDMVGTHLKDLSRRMSEWHDDNTEDTNNPM